MDEQAPIAAEDFVYLWERMRDEPGVADAAGYRLITDVRSRAGGKAVDVVFSQRYPAWNTLFANPAPVHLLGRSRLMDRGARDRFPASGGPFRVVSVDRARGEVLLTRNDQYLGHPHRPSTSSCCPARRRRMPPTGSASGTSTLRCRSRPTPSGPR